jgi:hypothetical protein
MLAYRMNSASVNRHLKAEATVRKYSVSDLCKHNCALNTLNSFGKGNLYPSVLAILDSDKKLESFFLTSMQTGTLTADEVCKIRKCFSSGEGRRRGSVYAALLTGLFLIVVASALWTPMGSSLGIGERSVDSSSLLLFGLVLVWWTFSGRNGLQLRPYFDSPNLTIGFETITMVVTVVTAVVAIFALTHDAYKVEATGVRITIVAPGLKPRPEISEHESLSIDKHSGSSRRSEGAIAAPPHETNTHK